MSREVNSAIAAALHAEMTGRSWKTKAQLRRDSVLLAREVLRQIEKTKRMEASMERFILRTARRRKKFK